MSSILFYSTFRFYRKNLQISCRFFSTGNLWKKKTSEKFPQTGYFWLQMMVFRCFNLRMVAQRENFRVLRTQPDFYFIFSEFGKNCLVLRIWSQISPNHSTKSLCKQFFFYRKSVERFQNHNCRILQEICRKKKYASHPWPTTEKHFMGIPV